MYYNYILYNPFYLKTQSCIVIDSCNMYNIDNNFVVDIIFIDAFFGSFTVTVSKNLIVLINNCYSKCYNTHGPCISVFVGRFQKSLENSRYFTDHVSC